MKCLPLNTFFEKDKVAFIITLFILSSSCNHKEDPFTYTVTSTHFESSVVIEGLVEPIQFTNLICPGNVDGIVTYLVDNGTYVDEGDIVCIIEDNNQQNNHDNLEIALESAVAELSKVSADLKMQYALLEAQVKNNEVDTDIAHLDSLQLKFSTPTQRKIKELELEKAYIEKSMYEKKLHSLDIINQSEIRKLEINIQQLTNRLASAKQILAGLTVRAPKKGLAIVADSRMTGTKLKVGDNVWSNMPLVIIPETSEMKVKMFVNETDFRSIGESDSVTYSFDAMPGNWGYGKIIKKLPVGQPHQRDSKVRFFEVEASVDSVYQLPEPGFTANSRVINTFVSDTIVIPQVAIHDVDSMKVVYVKNHRRFEMREVALGASSMKEAIIARGLQAGEVVSLTVPPESSIKGRKLLEDLKLLEDPKQHEESELHEESKQLEKPELLEEPKLPDETL